MNIGRASSLHGNNIRDFGPGRDLGTRNNIRSGRATSRGWTCTLEDNPIGFCLIISGKATCVELAIAEILYAFGLVGDPIAHITHALPLLAQ